MPFKTSKAILSNIEKYFPSAKMFILLIIDIESESSNQFFADFWTDYLSSLCAYIYCLYTNCSYTTTTTLILRIVKLLVMRSFSLIKAQTFGFDKHVISETRINI